MIKNQVTPSVLITGAARRIGRALALKFHELGFNTTIHYHRSEKQATELCDTLNKQRQGSATRLKADLNSMTEISALAQAFLDTWGRCNLLINNASSFYPTPFETTTEKQWDDLQSSNLKAPFFLSQALAHALKKNQGQIINIADIHAYKPLKNHGAYSIAKAGNIMLTKALALELSPHVRVNGIAPGAIMWPEDENNQLVPNEKRLELIPLKRIGGEDSIVKTAQFIATQGNYLTGEVISVDGGARLS